MRIYMQTRPIPEQPLRFYQLQIQPDLLGGWSLVRESGRQGYKGVVKKEFYENIEEAEQALIRWRDKQVNKGFQVMFREGTTQD
ncbi:MAG: WGR domain-containing protein [Gammaproteobacteria bacterium]|nr:WGR domain-containing protein [Gammaproteobacteria bacterium]